MLKYLFFGVSLLSLALPVLAQESDGDLPEPAFLTDCGPGEQASPDGCAVIGGYRVIDEDRITVTATGTRIEVEDTGQQVSVIGEREILAVQGPDVTRVLERVPGLAFSRNGPQGSFTGVRLRGAEAEQVLVMLDGVRLADAAAPAGGFDFGTLPALNLEKVEVLRGSNSTIWGADAVGGVIALSSRAASGLAASAEYGSRDSFAGTIAGGFSDEDLGFVGLSASHTRTNGFSAAAGGSEDDGFGQWVLDGHARAYLSPVFELFARARHVASDLDIDGFPAPDYLLTDTAERQETRQLFASAGAVYDTGPLFVAASYARSQTARDNFDPVFGSQPSFTSEGSSDRLTLRGEWRPIGPLLLYFGAENDWSRYETAFDAPASTRSTGVYAQGGIEYGAISAHAGLRFDDHADFGGATSFGADISYEVAPDVRLRASLGEGFKPPSLFQLFSDYGNRALQPERSTSADLGIAVERAGFAVSLAAFQRLTEDQIVYIGCFGTTSGLCANRPFGTYDNLGRTRARGFEAEAQVALARTLTASAVYAFTHSEDRITGSNLPRRPRHAATLSLGWQADADLELAADVRLVSNSFDDAANLVPLEGYAVLTLRGSWQLTQQVQIFGRVENVTGEDYQSAAGYASPGRGVFVGARLAL